MKRASWNRLPAVLALALLTTATMASLAASAAGAASATLKAIASRVDGRAGVVAIEASDPVSYVAAQPDPLTFVVELRDVATGGFADRFKPDPRHPVSAVQVESAVAADGAAVARIRMSLVQPLRPRVRSSRNMIYVEADRLDRPVRTAGTISAAGPSSAILHVRAARRGAATAVTLAGSGRLTALRVETPEDGAPRLLLDLANTTSAVPGMTPVGEGPVERVRIGLNPASPFVTSVVMDLTRRAPYRVESSPDQRELTVVFEEPAGSAGPPSAEPALRTQTYVGRVPRRERSQCAADPA